MNIVFAIAAFAVFPLAIGPLPDERRTFTLTLCGGGEITISAGGKEDNQDRDCHKQGCHAGNCREKSGRKRQT